MKWNMISTGDIALRKGGSVDPKKHQEEVFELYSIPAFDAGAPEVVAGSAIGSSKKAVQPNDVMISRIVPHIRRACVVGPANGHRQIASGEWIIFRDERIWPRYLRWVLVGDVFHSDSFHADSLWRWRVAAQGQTCRSVQDPDPPPTPRRAEADCGDSGCGGHLAGQAPRGPRPARHPHPIHLPRHVRRSRHQSDEVARRPTRGLLQRDTRWNLLRTIWQRTQEA